MKTKFNPCLGFTLIELVIVIVIIGIVSAISAPKFFNISVFEERGFYDETLSAIRFAHKSAIASGCDYRVVINASGYDITKRSGCDSGSFSAITNPATGTGGFSAAKPNKVSISGSLDFYYDNTGKPFTLAGSEIVSVSSMSVGGRNVRIEPFTGFIH